LDINQDGVLSKEELSLVVGEENANEIMKSVDLNGDDQIEISEFANAAMDFKILPEELI
jgi:Ca2+-binding EF-hand superfamily protein